MTMRFDIPTINKTIIGFPHIERMIQTANSLSSQQGYPPYNLEITGEDKYRVTIAVAGFKEADLKITVESDKLRVSGSKSGDDADRRFLHKGLANRSFERTFQLADHVEVVAADLRDGLLNIDLVREVPEEAKPKTIQIEVKDGYDLEGKAGSEEN